jgi:hypothetical protein
MKHAVATLEGALLDAAVAQCEGIETVEGRHDVLLVWSQDDGVWRGWTPSRSWHDGGPLVEREQITVIRMGGTDGYWSAGYEPEVDEGRQCESGWLELPSIRMRYEQSGPTALIAAMRAYVASKLGDEIDLPYTEI